MNVWECWWALISWLVYGICICMDKCMNVIKCDILTFCWLMMLTYHLSLSYMLVFQPLTIFGHLSPHDVWTNHTTISLTQWLGFRDNFRVRLKRRASIFWKAPFHDMYFFSLLFISLVLVLAMVGDMSRLNILWF